MNMAGSGEKSETFIVTAADTLATPIEVDCEDTVTIERLDDERVAVTIEREGL